MTTVLHAWLHNDEEDCYTGICLTEVSGVCSEEAVEPNSQTTVTDVVTGCHKFLMANPRRCHNIYVNCTYQLIIKSGECRCRQAFHLIKGVIGIIKSFKSEDASWHMSVE